MVNLESERLKFIRKQLGMTQADIASLLGISKQFYSQAETGKTKLSKEKIVKLCIDLSISADWLLLNLGTPFKAKNTLKKISDIEIAGRANKLYKRLQQIQASNDFDDKEMSTNTAIPIGRYRDLVSGKEKPLFREIINIKENFDVDLDWLLFGYNEKSPEEPKTLHGLNLTPSQYNNLMKMLGD